MATQDTGSGFVREPGTAVNLSLSVVDLDSLPADVKQAIAELQSSLGSEGKTADMSRAKIMCTDGKCQPFTNEPCMVFSSCRIVD
jgi:hypothetical protein